MVSDKAFYRCNPTQGCLYIPGGIRGEEMGRWGQVLGMIDLDWLEVRDLGVM